MSLWYLGEDPEQTMRRACHGYLGSQRGQFRMCAKTLKWFYMNIVEVYRMMTEQGALAEAGYTRQATCSGNPIIVDNSVPNGCVVFLLEGEDIPTEFFDWYGWEEMYEQRRDKRWREFTMKAHKERTGQFVWMGPWHRKGWLEKLGRGTSPNAFAQWYMFQPLPPKDDAVVALEQANRTRGQRFEYTVYDDHEREDEE